MNRRIAIKDLTAADADRRTRIPEPTGQFDGAAVESGETQISAPSEPRASDLTTGVFPGGGASAYTDEFLHEPLDVIGGTGGDDSLVGTAGSDQLIGLDGNDTLSGGGGNDDLLGGAGDDLLIGGTGIDTAVYDEDTAPVNVNLATGSSTSATGDDTLESIENVHGTLDWADTLAGNIAANLLVGWGGDDTLIGAGGNDTLKGHDADDDLRGGAGNDVLNGGGNDDTLNGHLGNDELNGAAGTDKATFGGAAGETGFGRSDGVLTLVDRVAGNGDDGTDGARSVETLQFADADFTVLPGGETLANTESIGDQTLPAIAVLADGGFVVTWQSLGQDAMGVGIYAQRYAADGSELGPEFRVNTYETNDQARAAIAALADGGFVIVWHSLAEDGSLQGVYAQRYAANGAAAGAQLHVSTQTAGDQQYASVAALAGGGFVVAWESWEQDGASGGIYAQRYDAAGDPAGTELLVNAVTAGSQTKPTIAALGGGGFAVAWESDVSGNAKIVARVFDVDGVATTGDVAVSTIAGSAQADAAIAALEDGGFAIAWRSDQVDGDIRVRRFDASGVAQGGSRVVNTTTDDLQQFPAIFGLSGGGYVVAWQSKNQDGPGAGIFAKRFATDDSPIGGEFIVNATTPSNQVWPALAAFADGGFLAAWQSRDGNGQGILAQRFDATGALDLAGIVATAGADRIDLGAPGDLRALGLDGDDLYIVDSSTDVVVELPGEGIDRVESSASYQLGAAVEDLTLTLPVVNAGPLRGTGNALDNRLQGNSQSNILDGDGGLDTAIHGVVADSVQLGWQGDYLTVNGIQVGLDYLRGIETLRFTDRDYQLQSGGETRVNTATAGDHVRPTIAALADGGQVIAWVSTAQDGSGSGVYAQRYDAAGIAQGSEFRINDAIAGAQFNPVVAALVDGGFVVTWVVGSDPFDLMARRFDQDGAAAGAEFLVNDQAFYQVSAVDVTELADGGLVFTWGFLDETGLESQISAKRFDADGVAVTSEYKVNADSNVQEAWPSVVALSGGGHVITWQSERLDSAREIYAQRFDAAGAPAGGQFQVANETIDHQQEPEMAPLEGGGFVIVWTSLGQDGSGKGAYARIFDAEGNPVTDEFLVNTYTDDQQTPTSVTGLADGGFVVCWTSLNQDGSGLGVYLQRYDADGAPVGDEQRVSTTTLGAQGAVEVAALADGGFVCTWSQAQSDWDYLDDNAGTGIYSQRYDADGNPYQREVRGTAGNDRIDISGSGDLQAAGGAGDDVYVVDTVADTVVEVEGQGTDRIESWVSWTLDATVENLTLLGQTDQGAFVAGTGNAKANQLTGNLWGNHLSGMDGDDTLDGGAGADTLEGGAGNDTYAINDEGDLVVEAAGEGTDTLRSKVGTTVLGDHIEHLVLLGTTAIEAYGNSLANAITGNVTGNVLDGGTGADTLVGGKGDDSYTVDDAGDVVTEKIGGGTDLVTTTLSYVLPAHVEQLKLDGDEPINGTGNILYNYIEGNDAANILDGGAFVDVLVGLGGSDTYHVDTASDAVVEETGEGTDTVRSPVSYTLPDNVENLVLTGTGSIDGTGNALANTLTGYSGANGLYGLEGNDTLAGDAGDDTLDGGTGTDQMQGSFGDDLYIVGTADVITEAPDQGIDTVSSSISWTLGYNFEVLNLTGSIAVSGTGNSLDNTITGNDAANAINGNGGDDSITGGGGNDSIIGYVGNDTMNGGSGVDTLIGGPGHDTYFIDNAGDVVIELAGAGTDSVYTIVNDYTLPANVENLVYSDPSVLIATGNVLGNYFTGNDADNTLDGKGGADTLAGGLGDDTYIVENAGDTVLESTGQGKDSVQASINYKLPENDVENLMLSGVAKVGTGNALDNTLSGTGGDNTLDGGAGADTLAGGAGDDTYVLGAGADTVQEAGSDGTDTVLAGVNVALADNVENAVLTGVDNLTVLGNAGDNVLTANTGSNLFAGDAGTDTVSYEAAIAGVTVDLSQSGAQFTGGSATDTLIGIENLTGSGYADALSGSADSNTLDGGAGIDVMAGGDGDDTYLVDDPDDDVIEAPTVVAQLALHAVGANVLGDPEPSAGGSNIDIVIAQVSYTLRANVENLMFAGTSDLSGNGNDGNNVLTGNGGHNTLNGKAGVDILGGGVGNDTLDGGTGVDTMGGGAGDDTYIVDNKDDVILPEGSSQGADTVQSSISWTLTANLETLTLTGGAVINGTGSAGANTLNGNAMNNALYGADGADALLGFGGTDALYGGRGKDTLSGGADVDYFVFNTGPSATEFDTMSDFVSGTDRIRLDDDVFTAFNASVSNNLGASAFYATNGSSAHDADDRIIYNTGTGALFYDPDGNGATAAIKFAVLAGAPTLAAADFVIVS